MSGFTTNLHDRSFEQALAQTIDALKAEVEALKAAQAK